MYFILLVFLNGYNYFIIWEIIYSSVGQWLWQFQQQRSGV